MIQLDHHRNYPNTMLRLRKHEIPSPKFLLDVRSDKVIGLSQKIKALDGHYINSKSFEKSATHVIIDIIKCNEKFLGACVRGLWVLPPKYIEDSYQVGVWMKEEDYEHKLQNHLAGAAQRWRWRISKYAEQPFTGLHVALLLSANSEDYKRLLIFGGAEVHKLSLPLRADNNLSQVSYVFTDHFCRDHIQTLTEYGLICLHYMFIVDTIIKDEELDILKYVVKEDFDTTDFQLLNVSCERGHKTTRICEISQSSQTNIQEIKVLDDINNGVDLTIDSQLTVGSSQIKTFKPKVTEQDKDKKVVKENSDSCNKNGLKVKPLNMNSQHPVMNVLSQKKLNFGGKPSPGHCKSSNNSCLQSLPLVQGNIQLHDCQSSVKQKPHVINGERLFQGDNSVEYELVWEKTSVHSQDSSVWEEVEWEKQDSNSCSVSQSDMHTDAYGNTPSLANTRMSFKSGNCSSRQDIEKSRNSSNRKDKEKSGNSSNRQDIEKFGNNSSKQDIEKFGNSLIRKAHEKFGNSSSRQDVENSGNSSCRQNIEKSGNSSSKQDIEKSGNSSSKQDIEKSGNSSSKQDIEKSGNSSSKQDNEKSGSSSSRQDDEDKSGSSSSRQYNENKSGNTSGKQYNADKSGRTSGKQYNEDKSGSTSGKQANAKKSGSFSDEQVNAKKSESFSAEQVNAKKSENFSAEQVNAKKSESFSAEQVNAKKSGSFCGSSQARHRSLFNDIVIVVDNDDDMVNTRIPSKPESPSSRRSSDDKSGSVCCRQDNGDKNRSLFTDIIIVDDDDDDMVNNTRIPSKSDNTCNRQYSEDKSENVCGSQDNEDTQKSLFTEIIIVDDDDDDDVANTRIPSKSESPSSTQSCENKSGSVCGSQGSKEKYRNTSGRHDKEAKHRSLWSDIICIDDDEPSEVKPNESISVNPPSSPPRPNVIIDRIHPPKSSPEASCPKIPSTPEMFKCSPQTDKPAPSPVDKKLSPVTLLTIRKNFQPSLQSFGFSSSSRKRNDSESKEGLSLCQAALATTSVKGIGKRKKSASAALKTSTPRGLAKRRALNTAKSCPGITVKGSPEWSSISKEEEPSMAVERIEASVCDTASISSTAIGYIRTSRPSVLSQSSKTELPQQTTQSGLAKSGRLDTVSGLAKSGGLDTVSGLAKSRGLETVLSLTECPSGSGDKESSLAVESTQSNINGYIKTINPPLQSSNTELPRQTKHTHRGLAKRKAVNDSGLLSKSKVAKTPCRSASSDCVSLSSVLDVSVHRSNTKSPFFKMNKSVCKSLSWSSMLANQATRTQCGLAINRASLAQIQEADQSNPSWCPAGRSHQNGVQCVTHDDSEYKCDSSTNDLQDNMFHPASQLSSSCGQTRQDGKNQSAINGLVARSEFRTEKFTNSSRSVTEARMAADSLNAEISEKVAAPEEKLENLQNSDLENDSSDRSLFKSFSKYFSDIKPTMSCSDSNLCKGFLKDEPGPSSELTASADVHMLSTVSKNSGDIKGRNLFNQVIVPGNTATTTYRDDSIDLPTPPSVICHDSDGEAAEAPTAHSATSEAVIELSVACNPSIVKACVEEEAKQQLQFQKKICNKHTEPSTCAQPSPVYPLWPLTYLLSYNTGTSQSPPFLPEVYGDLMQSSREMGFFDQAVAHARPAKSRLPTSLMLSELVPLARCTVGDVCPQAMHYLYSWLALHPPLTPITVRLYSEAFELSSESSILFDILTDVKDDSKQSSAILLLEYFITVFEINFEFSLKSGEKSFLKKCLIVEWLWKNSYTIVIGKTIHRLLDIFEYIIRAPVLNCRACIAVCALLSLACECLRLANIQWDHCNPKFLIDSVITVSRDIAQRIHSSFKTGDKAKGVVLDMLRPAWLRILVAAKLLSYYNNYLLSDQIHANGISMNSIVSQFFLLVPLEPSGQSDAHNHVENNHSIEHISKHSEEVLYPTKGKRQKGVLTAEKVNKRNGKGESAIHIACMKNKAADLEKLLEVPGADVNLRDNNGWTPLHEACHHGRVACVELLLKYVPRPPGDASASQEQISSKVDIDAQGPDGLTPLQDAVCNNKIEVCKLLLRYGGKKLLKTKTHYNYTALDFAKSDEMKAVLNGSFEESSLFDLSISQDFDDPARISDGVRDIAPLTQRYKEIIGTDHSHLASRSSCEEFLRLLTVLVSAYYSIFESLEKSHKLDPKEKDVLENMNVYLRLFRRHLRKLTRPEDFDRLQFRLECFESLCIYKPDNVYLKH